MRTLRMYLRQHCVVLTWLGAAGLAGCGGPNTATVGPSPQTTSAPNAATTTAIPPYAAAGTVREVNGAPFAGVTVETAQARTDPGYRVTVTDEAGHYSLTGITTEAIYFGRDGFLGRGLSRERVLAGDATTVKLQPILTLSVDQPVTNAISTDDLTYLSEHEDPFSEGTYLCSPCKEIRIRPAAFGVRFRLRWSGPTPLDIWAGESYGRVIAHAEGNAGASEVVLDVTGGAGDTLLVGVGARDGVPQPISTPAAFVLSLEPR